MRYLDRLQPLALLLMRLTLGAIMMAHGYQKFSHGLQHFAGWVGSIGVPSWNSRTWPSPSKRHRVEGPNAASLDSRARSRLVTKTSPTIAELSAAHSV